MRTILQQETLRDRNRLAPVKFIIYVDLYAVRTNLVSQGAPEYLELTLLGNAVYLVAGVVVALKYTRHSRITPEQRGGALSLLRG